MTDTEARCIKCGHPRSNHPFRHPFRPDREVQPIQQLRDALDAAEAEVARLTEALQRIVKRDEQMIWGEDCEVKEAFNDMRDIARAALEAKP